MSTKYILIVAAPGDDIHALATYLEERGLVTEVASEESEALPLFGRRQHDIVLVDSDIPGLVLADFVKAVLRVRPTTSIIVITRSERPSELHRAVEIGVTCYAKKPFDREGLFLQMAKL